MAFISKRGAKEIIVTNPVSNHSWQILFHKVEYVSYSVSIYDDWGDVYGWEGVEYEAIEDDFKSWLYEFFGKHSAVTKEILKRASKYFDDA